MREKWQAMYVSNQAGRSVRRVEAGGVRAVLSEHEQGSTQIEGIRLRSVSFFMPCVIVEIADVGMELHIFLSGGVRSVNLNY